RLADWLAEYGLVVGTCTAKQYNRVRQLREASYAVATAVANGEALPESAVQVINDCSVQGRQIALLMKESKRLWRWRPASCGADALSVIAVDAISILAGERDGKLALCASPSCQAAFFDTSQSRSRRWCDMGTCGNKEKKARFMAKRRGTARVGK